MSRKMIGALFLGLAWTGALLAAQEPVQGAKELFYDPVGAGATRVSPGAQASPSGTSRPQPARPLVRRDGNGRRTVSLPPNPEGGATPTALGISYWIELHGASGGPGQQVTERHVFHSGDRIRLHFRSNSDGNIALIQLGSSGTAQILFPDPEQGLADSRLAANQDKVLPQASAWFRFDDKPGTERLIVLFARNREELDRFPLRPNLNVGETKSLVQNVQHIQGSKDLVIETETRTVGEVGTYGVNTAGRPVVLEIALEHR